MAENTAQIRVVKKGKGHGGHHGGAWKVAYADFVTAMMAFFLVMWIVGLNKNIKEQVAGYFKDPTAYKKAVAEGKNPMFPGKKSTAKPDPEGVKERSKLKNLKKDIEKLVEHTPKFKRLKQNIVVTIVNEGLRVDLLEGKESMFFDSASATVKPETRALLSMIAAELARLPNKTIIEGHTDSRPLSRTDGYTNWELSADRANQARHVMEAAGLRQDQIIQVRGYAATQPRLPDNPEHFSNRRVSIIVVLNAYLAQQHFGSGQASSEVSELKPSHR